MLTNQMHDTLAFIDESWRDRGVGVSVREIMQHLGQKSPSHAHKILKKLRSSGYIVWSENKARTIEVVRRPGDVEYRVFNSEEKRFGPLLKHTNLRGENLKRTAR